MIDCSSMLKVPRSVFLHEARFAQSSRDHSIDGASPGGQPKTNRVDITINEFLSHASSVSDTSALDTKKYHV